MGNRHSANARHGDAELASGIALRAGGVAVERRANPRQLAPTVQLVGNDPVLRSIANHENAHHRPIEVSLWRLANHRRAVRAIYLQSHQVVPRRPRRRWATSM